MNVIITGANRGIGYAIMDVFTSKGWNVWACIRREDEPFAERTAQMSAERGVWIKPIYMELSSDDQIKRGLGEIFSDKQPIHALVNNAGVGHYDLFQRTSVRQARELFEINFFAPFQIMQYVLRKMDRQGFGAVVNITSRAARYVNQGDSLYAASKAALEILTKDIAAEYGAKNIRVNAVAPGPTETALLEKTTSNVGERILSNISIGRLGSPREIANAVFFLVSEDASFINGEILTVDGGLC